MNNSNKIVFKPMLAGLILPAILLSLPAGRAVAQLDPGGDYGPTNVPLESWSFSDQAGWTDDDGFVPLAFTNLNYSLLGNGKSLVVDTNIEAFLRYPVWATDGWTNLTVDNGSVTFWFAPNWNSVGDTNGGAGPGDDGRLLETGHYTDDSSHGWWSIFVDSGGTNLCFAAQTNDLSSSLTVYLHTPIDWTTNYFHFIALTYSPTSSCMYVDGVLMTNGPGVTIYPGPEALTNGFWVGSDSNGTNQAHGLFNTLQTYNYPLNSNDVTALFNWYHTVTNPPSPIATAYNRRTVHYFHQGGGQSRTNLGEYLDPGNFAKEGMEYRTETYGGDNKLYHVAVKQVNQASLGNARYFPYTQLTLDCDYLGGGTPRVTAAAFAYDTSTGNLTNEVDYGEVTGFNPTSTGSFSFTDASPADTEYHATHYAARIG